MCLPEDIWTWNVMPSGKAFRHIACGLFTVSLVLIISFFHMFLFCYFTLSIFIHNSYFEFFQSLVPRETKLVYPLPLGRPGNPHYGVPGFLFKENPQRKVGRTRQSNSQGGGKRHYKLWKAGARASQHDKQNEGC